MLDLAFKNIKRQKTRTFLTVLGIVIGIAAIVALGSFAEGINIMVQEELEPIAGKIMVIQKGSGGYMTGFQGSDITDEQIENIKSIAGLEDVVPMSMYIGKMVPMRGPEWVVIGIDITKGRYFVGENIEMHDGRDFVEGETGVVTIGKTIADRYNLEVGDYFTVKNDDFEIIGIYELTNVGDVDTGIIMPIEDMHNLLDTDTYQMVFVIPEDVRETEIIAEKIEDEDEMLSAVTEKEMSREVSQVVDQIRIMTFGIGAIAAVVGGLGVMNTMIMAVMERRREIGVMKAVGATNRMVLQQILTESALISLIGGFIGLFLGMLASFGMTGFTGGFVTAAVTPLLAATAIGFAFLLGIIGGLYPAWKAGKLDPVEALRYE